MSTLVPQYDVVLRSDLPQRERELLEHTCCKLTSHAGPDLLDFTVYGNRPVAPVLHRDADFQARSRVGSSSRIPHHFVFLISGSVEHAAIGFLPGAGAQKEFTDGH
jgi:hypothetical protein